MGGIVMGDRPLEPGVGPGVDRVVPRFLRELREARGWSREELAVRCRAEGLAIEAMSLSVWESGHGLPSVATLSVLLESLGSSWMDFDLALRQAAGGLGSVPAFYRDLAEEWERRSRRRSLRVHWLSRVSSAEVLAAAEAAAGRELKEKARRLVFRHWAELLELLARYRKASDTDEVELEAVRMVNRSDGSLTAPWPEGTSEPARRIASRLRSHRHRFRRGHLGGRQRDFDLALEALEVVLERWVKETRKLENEGVER